MKINRNELAVATINFLNEAKLEHNGFGRWALDSTGVAMPLDLAEFGAKWQHEHTWHNPADEPEEYRMVLFSPTNGKHYVIGKTYHYAGTYYISAHGEMYYQYDIRHWAYLDDLTPNKE